MLSAFSKTVKFRPAFFKLTAASKPAMPAPIMAVRFWRLSLTL
jgi:hypothetical protein